MFTNTSVPLKRKQSGSTNKRFHLLNPKGKPELAVDTSFSQYNARVPQQVFPYESKTQELNFPSFQESKPAKQGTIRGLKQQLENTAFFRGRLGSPSNQSAGTTNNETHQPEVILHADTEVSQSAAVKYLKPSEDRSTLSERPSFLHNRIRGLRPSALDLTPGVSPSDRSIPIGLEVPATDRNRPHNLSQAMSTPDIRITGTEDDFGLRPMGAYRPPSSVYSRYTNCVPKRRPEDDTPPMPPLPLFLTENARDAPPEYQRTIQVPAQIHSPSQLPTGRRSKGWWNFITSPFSASSASKAFFWRSPTLPDQHADFEHNAILRDASGMGQSNAHAGFIFLDRSAEDGETRSAPASDSGSWIQRSLPRRSQTAPGALDEPGAAALNIYRIPSQGAAAAYYDPNRHFPSVMMSDKDGSILDWSPSDSVAHADKGIERRHAMPGTCAGSTPETQAPSTPASAKVLASRTSPFADVHENDAYHPSGAGATIYNMPSEGDYQKFPQRAPPYRQSTHVTVESHFSPLSPSPVVGHAHLATRMGPESTNGEPREVDMSTPRGQYGYMVTERNALEEPSFLAPPMPEKAYYRPSHSRTSSYGLGISDEEHGLFPPPRPLSEKLMLRTDFFGQLQVRKPTSSIHDDEPQSPWYRRYLWLIVATAIFCTILTLIGIVMGATIQHSDTSVEAGWKNLTDFPPLPTGVATVARPNAVKQVSGCVSPQSLWSCALPAEQREDLKKPGQANQPNFRFEIRFKNSSSFPANATMPVKRSTTSSGTVSQAYAALKKRDIWTTTLFTPNPAPPSSGDRQFLGSSTDNITAQGDNANQGEETPFYISLVDALTLASSSSDKPSTSPHQKRSSEINPFPYPIPADVSTHAPSTIPSLLIQQNGAPTSATLYPYVSAQPLRLYNRGLPDEHYGFYTYFDRSLFMSNLSSTTVSSGDSSSMGQNATSNAALKDAEAVCTWSQTRLHVQIWTQKAPVTALNPRIQFTGGDGVKAVNSTANVLDAAPGSFPYAVTISLDRHGGESGRKGVFCYGLDAGRKVLKGAKLWIAEDRGFEGKLVNPADVPGGSSGGNGTVSKRGDEGRGVDGGTGGCACQWQNWKS